MTTAPPVAPEVGFFELPLSAVASATRETIVVVDSLLRIVALNEAATRMFGYAQASIEGQALSCLISEDQRAQHAEQMRAFMATGQAERRAFGHDAIRGLRSNGQDFPAEASISRVELPVGGRSSAYFVAMIRDLSVERSLQVEVTKLTERLRTMLDLMPVAIWIVDGEQVVYANQAAVALFGVPDRGHLIGQSIYTLLCASGHASLRAHLTQALDGTPLPSFVNGTIVRPDGQARELEIASTALPDHGRTVMQMVIIDVTQTRAQAQLEAQHRLELRQLAANVVEAREEERRRIARELHDELGQRLTALKMELASLRSDGAGIDAAARIAVMLEMVDNTVAALRRIAADLRPLMLDDLGLNAAIESLARDVAARSEMEVMVRLGVDDPALAPGADIALYRMVQEALTNVGRHAQATDVHIELRQDGDELVLTVHDNGRGFPERSTRHDGRYGLLGIRERAIMLGGRLGVDNPPGGGGRITVRLPLKPPARVGGPAA
jgi:two-component system, NarL family, sensor histidine kinase UhpB